MDLGKRWIHNELIASAEFRHTTLFFGVRYGHSNFTGGKSIKIPIPFMKKDHGILLRVV